MFNRWKMQLVHNYIFRHLAHYSIIQKLIYLTIVQQYIGHVVELTNKYYCFLGKIH